MSSEDLNLVEVPRPNSLVLKIYGCVSSYEEQVKELDLYLKNNLKSYLWKHWKEKKILIVRNRLIRENKLNVDSGIIDIPSIPEEAEKDEIILDALVNSILWRLERPLSKGSIVYALQDWIWSDGYTSGNLKSHIYQDAAECLKIWKFKHMIKMYSCEMSHPSGQKLFLQSTQLGDFTKYFNNYIMFSEKRSKIPEEYRKICFLLREQLSQFLFITNSNQEASAAHSAKVSCILINRSKNVEPSTSQTEIDISQIPKISSFHQIKFIETGVLPPCC